MSNSETLLGEVLAHIRWLSLDDPIVTRLAAYLRSDLVTESDQTVPRLKEDEWWFDEWWEDEYCYEERCCGTSDCQDECCNGCYWPLRSSMPYASWQFQFDGDEYQLNTPQMILYRLESCESFKIQMPLNDITADDLLEAINLLLIQEVSRA